MGSPPVNELIEQLQKTIRSLGDRVIVAFSGGVDSSVVAKVATEALGADNVLCVTAKSESNTDEDIALCQDIARNHGLNHRVIEYSELAIPNYSDNPANRCYFCKGALYDRLNKEREAFGAAAVLDGTITEDLSDYRPGLKAVAERGVQSPMKVCGLSKDQVRAIAAHYGLPNQDKPASPCLSSRIPYGHQITAEKLHQVAKAEAFIRGLGLRQFRCRHHGELVRIEALVEDIPQLMNNREAIVTEMKKIGFLWVSLDLAGFQSGSLNAALGIV